MLNLPFPLTPQLMARLRAPRVDARIVVPAAASSAFTTVVVFNMPQNQRGFLHQYAAEVIDPSYDYGGSLTFRVVAGGSPIDDVNNGSFTELRGTRVFPAETLAYVQPGDAVLVQVQRTLAAAVPQAVCGVLKLYTWPIELDPTYPRKAPAAPSARK